MSKPRPFSVVDKETPRIIRRLINFFGSAAIDKALAKYEMALQTSGPILATYYTPYRHPWWDSLRKYLEMEKSGRSSWKHMTGHLERSMVGDAYKIGVLQAKMPTSVKDKFRKDLVDDNNARAYLFEIQMASHYYQYGYEISWYEDDGNPRPEFKVTADDFEFDVECKRFSTDASRKIRRVDFYRLAEWLIPEISKKRLCGTIDIELTDRLHSSTSHLKNMSDQIQQAISADGLTSVIEIPDGKVILSLSPPTGRQVEWSTLFSSMEERKHHAAHGAIFATGSERIATDPIEMTIAPQKSEKVLQGIESKIKDAAKQFEGTRPGLICCYLEGINELSDLAKEGGLKVMSNYLLDRSDMSHVIGISYCAEPRLERNGKAENFTNQGLLFRNPTCRFEVPEGVRFLTDEE